MKEREEHRARVIQDTLDHLLATSTVNVPPRPALHLPARVSRSVWRSWWLFGVLGVLILSFAAPRSWVVPPLAALLVWPAAHPVLLILAVTLWSGVLGIAAVSVGTALGSASAPSAGDPLARRS